MGKDKTQTVTQTLDPKSQGFVDRTRSGASDAQGVALNTPGSFFEGPNQSSIMEQLRPFLDPYINQVIGGLGGQYDQLRGQAGRSASQAATQAGAYGGSRSAIESAVRKSELDRAQTQQVGGLLSNQFNTALGQGLQYSEYQRALRERMLQEPLFRQQMAQGFMTGGLGPTGSSQTAVQPGSFWGDAVGAGLTGLGFLAGGPPGAAAASQLGGGGGGFQIPGTTQAGGLFSGARPGLYR